MWAFLTVLPFSGEESPGHHKTPTTTLGKQVTVWLRGTLYFKGYFSSTKFFKKPIWNMKFDPSGLTQCKPDLCIWFFNICRDAAVLNSFHSSASGIFFPLEILPQLCFPHPVVFTPPCLSPFSAGISSCFFLLLGTSLDLFPGQDHMWPNTPSTLVALQKQMKMWQQPTREVLLFHEQLLEWNLVQRILHGSGKSPRWKSVKELFFLPGM